MEKDRDWFISKYNEIHENLILFDNELSELIKDKNVLLNNDNLLKEINYKIKNEIENLEKIRKYEREIFKYDK